MKINELNNTLRLMFNSLIERGFKKFPMADVTLGRAFSPQFNKFLVETDLGLNPLERMVNGLGYELHLIPIKPGDNEFKKSMDDKYNEFIENSKNDLIDHIENRPTKQTTGKVTQAFNDEVENLLADLE
jgi:hypothetical protein